MSENCIFGGGSDVEQTLGRIFVANSHLATISLNSGAVNSGSMSEIVVGLKQNKTLQELTLDFSQCNPCVFRTLLEESNSNLVRIIHSNLLSFIRTDSGWKVELNSLSCEALNFVQCLLQADLRIHEVTASCLDVPRNLNLGHHFQLIIGVITSLESCNKLNALHLYIDRYLQCNNEVLGSALEQIIGKNPALEHIELYGNVSDTIAAGIIAGLKSMGHSSIKVLGIETSHLSISSITGLMKTFNESNLNQICFSPRLLPTVMGLLKGYCVEMVKRNDENNSSWTIDSEEVVSVVCTCLEVPLAIALFSCLQQSSSHITSLNLSGYKQLVNLGESVYQALEQMLICNKSIKVLSFRNSINDTVLKYIARGIMQNQNVHTMIITISDVSDNALKNLLSCFSYSNSSLTIKIVDHVIFLIRYISETNSMDTSTKLVKHMPSLFYKPCEVGISSIDLKRVLNCLSNSHSGCLKEFEFSFSTENLSNDVILLDSKTVTLSEHWIKSLQTLKLCNPVTNDIIKKLAAGLDGNDTLTHLALHPRTLNIGNIKLIFEALYTSNIIKLEFINELLFFKVGTQWKLEVIKYDLLMVLPTAYNALSELLNTSGIDIATIIDKNVRNITLKFPDVNNNYLALLILRSMANGDYRVRKLDLIFNVDIDNPQDCGNAIEGMLTTCNSLKKLTIVNLRNDVIAFHLIAGLAQNSSLFQLCVKGHYVYDSSFLQNLLKMRLVSPSIQRICIGDEFSLQRRSQTDPWKELNSQPKLELNFDETMCSAFSDIMMTTLGIESNTNDYYEGSGNMEDLPRDGSWRIMPTSERNSMLSTFSLLNKIMCNTCTTSSIGGLIFEYLQNLNLSGTHLNCKQLASLFEELQENTSVISLDVSFSIYHLPHDQDLNMHHTLRGMLERNKSIKILNLTGIVDEKIAAALANSVQKCSLVALSINFTTKDYSFSKLEDILDSFMYSKNLLHLELTNFCVIQKKESLMHIDLFTKMQCQFWQLPSNVELLQSWCILFLFHVLTKHCCTSGLGISVYKHLKDGLMKKVFKNFFNVQVDSWKLTANAAENVAITLQELHLDITVQSFALFSIMIEPFRNLRKLHLSHDVECSTNPMLALMYKRLISSSQTLELISFNGIFQDEMSNALGDGLIHNNTLQTLQFSATLLSVKALTHLLMSVCNSVLTCVQVIEGCCLNRHESKQPFDVVEFTGDKALLCKLFCASARVTLEEKTFLTSPSLLCRKVLDLSTNISSSHDKPNIDFVSLFEVTEEGFISQLILTGNKIVLHHNIDILTSPTSMLKILKLDHCHINDHDCEHIAMGLTINKGLKVLDLQHNDITSFGAILIFSSLLQNDTLQSLDLSGNALSLFKVSKGNSESIDALKQQDYNKSLQVLNLGLCHPSYVEFSSSLSTLKILTFSIEEEALLAKVIYLLKDSLTLEGLDIAESSVETPTMGLAIQQLLECNRSIKNLNMSQCKIPDDVCVLFSKGLEGNKHLEKLDLSSNNICGLGVLSMFSVLESNMCSLVELNMSSNWETEKSDSIKHEQIERINILSKNSSLKTLIVSEFYPFSDWFGVKLFEGLKQNNVLQKLDISDNIIRLDAFNELIGMLSGNSTLTDLNVRWVEFPACMTGLTEALLHCSSLKVITVDPVLEKY